MGYDAQSLYGLAKILTCVVGIPFVHHPQPPDPLLAKVLAAGAKPAYMKCVRDHYVAYAEGRKPVPWEDFARKHKRTFEEGFQSQPPLT